MRGLPRSRRPRPAALAAGIALLATLASAGLSQRVFGGVPHVADGVSYAFQGKIFAAGLPWLEPPPVPDAFETQNVLLTATRWCGIYPPAFPLLLAAGWLLGAPFLVNPILLGLAVLGVFRLGAVLYDETAGLLGAALLAVSPFALLMGGSFMGHVSSLCVFTWCLSFLAEAVLGGGRRPILAAGFLGAFGVVVRPQAAVLFLLPGLTALLVVRRREILRVLGLLAAGGFAPLAFLLGYNAALSGHPFRMAYLLWDPKLGFTYGFTPWQLLTTHLPWFLADLGATVWGFPFGDLTLLVFLLVPAAGRRRDAWLAAGALLLLAGFSSYRWYEINHSGPRYMFEALGVLALLSARAARTAAGLAARLLARFSLAWLAVPSAALAVAFLVVFPLATLLPRQAEALSHSYHAHTGEPLRRLGAEGAGPSALVLVAGNTVEWTYGSFLLGNGIDPRRAPRVYARDLPGRRAELLQAYPRAETWLVRTTLRALEHPNPWIDNTWDVVAVECRRLR